MVAAKALASNRAPDVTPSERIMQFDFSRNHFELFELTPGFALDSAALDQAYRALQSQVHPDKFTHLSQAEQRASMQWSTRVNEAYRALK